MKIHPQHSGAGRMKLGFEELQAAYRSGTQSARVWTERWVRDQMYCPSCGTIKISSFPNNSPVADFICASCKEEFELKSQKSAFGAKVLDGAFRTKCLRLAASNNPSPLFAELRPQATKRRQPDGRSEAFLCPEDHRRAKAAGSDCAPRRVDRLLHSAEPGPCVRQDFCRPGWTTTTEGRRPRSIEEDSLPSRRRSGS